MRSFTDQLPVLEDLEHDAHLDAWAGLSLLALVAGLSMLLFWLS
jgi:hypothetical protein